MLPRVVPHVAAWQPFVLHPAHDSSTPSLLDRHATRRSDLGRRAAFDRRPVEHAAGRRRRTTCCGRRTSTCRCAARARSRSRCTTSCRLPRPRSPDVAARCPCAPGCARSADRARAVFCVSEFTRGEALRLGGLDPARVHVTPLGVDPVWFAARASATARRHGCADDDLRRPAEAAQERRRGCCARSRACATASRTGSCSSRGTATSATSIARRLRSRRAIADRVELVQDLPFAELVARVRAAQFAVQPSLHEGFGLPALEAMAAGVPVLAGRAGAMPEVCGDAALYCDPESEDDIARALLRARQRHRAARAPRRRAASAHAVLLGRVRGGHRATAAHRVAAIRAAGRHEHGRCAATMRTARAIAAAARLPTGAGPAVSAAAHRGRARLARHVGRRRERAGRDPARLSGRRPVRARRLPAGSRCASVSAASARARRSCSACPARGGTSGSCCRCFRAPSSRSTCPPTTSSCRARTPSRRACARTRGQLHVCYCHTPMRYAWDLRDQYLGRAASRPACAALAVNRILDGLRDWDRRSERPRHALRRQLRIRAGPHRALLRPDGHRDPSAGRHRRSSRRSSPPCRSRRAATTSPRRAGFPTSGWTSSSRRFARCPSGGSSSPATGRTRPRVRAARRPNVEFVGHVPRERMRDLLRGARAFVFAAEEDFGILPVEAQACGTPVIAYGHGGALRDGARRTARPDSSSPTQTADAIAEAVRPLRGDARPHRPARLPRAGAGLLDAALRRRVHAHSSRRARRSGPDRPEGNRG